RRPARTALLHHGAAGLSAGHAAQREPATAPGAGDQGHAPDDARAPCLLGLAHADARSVGARDLLDRRRVGGVVRPGRFRLPGRAGGLHLHHAAAPRPHALRDAGDRAELVARAVTQQYTGVRRRLIETLRSKGIADLAVLRAFDLVPRHLFVPTGVYHRA